MHADMEFECIRNDVLRARLNITAANDHVREIERYIWTMKECIRATINGLAFRHLPKLMIKELVLHSTKVLNQFPAQNDISVTLSPLSIMTGHPNPNYNDLKLKLPHKSKGDSAKKGKSM